MILMLFMNQLLLVYESFKYSKPVSNRAAELIAVIQ